MKRSGIELGTAGMKESKGLADAYRAVMLACTAARQGRRSEAEFMSQLMNIGFGNVVNTDKVIAIISPESAPVKRQIQQAKENKTLIDATQGRKTKSVIFTSNDKIIVSALAPETLSGRFNHSDISQEVKD